MCGAELEVLFSWYDWLNSNIGLPLDLIVYLRTSPQVAYDRLRQRGRKEEAGVPMEFIEVSRLFFPRSRSQYFCVLIVCIPI